jgi:hypothetical protein
VHSKGDVRFLAERIGQVLQAGAGKRYISAISMLEGMIRCIAKVAMPINEDRLHISYPGEGEGEESVAATILTPTPTTCQIVERDHSIRAEYASLTFPTDSWNAATIEEVARLLQVHCNDLMRDYPRASVRNLRAAMLTLGNEAGIRKSMTITGEEIDK